MCCNIDNSICEEIKNKCYHLDNNNKNDSLTTRNAHYYHHCTNKALNNNNNNNLQNSPIETKIRNIQRSRYCSPDYSHMKPSDADKISLLDQQESKNIVALKKNNASILFTRKKVIQTLPDHLMHSQRHRIQQQSYKYRSLQFGNFNNKQKIERRKQQAHSWYAPIIDLQSPFEENPQQNLTAEHLTPQFDTNTLNESTLLLDSSHHHEEKQSIPSRSTAQPLLHPFRIRETKNVNDYQSSSINLNTIECPPQSTMSSLSLGVPTPRRRRFEQFIKTLVGRKSSKETNIIISANQAQQQTYSQQHLKLESLYTVPFTENHSVQPSALQFSNSPSIHQRNTISSQSLSSSSSISLTSTTGASLSPPPLPILSPPHSPIMSASTICITNVSSEMNLMNTNEHSISATSLNAYAHQKFRNVVPSLRRNNNCSCSNLHQQHANSNTSKMFTVPSPSPPPSTTTTTTTTMSQMAASAFFMPNKSAGAALPHTKSCYSVFGSGSKSDTTIMTSTQSAINVNNRYEPLRAQNRLRTNSSTQSITTCSRCSSILSIVAVNSSRYSLHVANGNFVKVDDCVKSDFKYDNGNADDGSTIEVINNAEAALSTAAEEICTSICNDDEFIEPSKEFICKLCLLGVPMHRATKMSQCGCSFCHECMTAYIDYEIFAGAFEISCPDALCPMQGILTIEEIKFLTPTLAFNKHIRYRLNREIELDKNRTWCPKPGCETVCIVDPLIVTDKSLTSQSRNLLQSSYSVKCPTCLETFCSGCKNSWHPSLTCEENKKRLVADGKEANNIGMPFNSDLIKCCPMCSVPIEKDEGCAQMMCKRCKHVFCWYCLASLDDDFLLRHYDKGPCKNKLGHSRASVVWHRAQVIGIFAGFGILLLIASPLLLLAAPCIVCCKCRICSGTTRLEENNIELEEVVALQQR